MLSQHQNASHIAKNVRKTTPTATVSQSFTRQTGSKRLRKKVKMVISSAIYANDFWLTMCNFVRLKLASDKPVNDL